MEKFKFEQSGSEQSRETLIHVMDETLAGDALPSQALKAALNAAGVPHENVGIWLEDASSYQCTTLLGLHEQLIREYDTEKLNAYEGLKKIAQEIATIIKSLE
jgi:hypothetical protein